MREFFAKIEAGTATTDDFDQIFPGSEFTQKSRARGQRNTEGDLFVTHLDRLRFEAEEKERIRRQAIADGKTTVQESKRWLEDYYKFDHARMMEEAEKVRELRRFYESNDNAVYAQTTTHPK